MYHKVRITVVSLVVMAICMLSSNGTLSYFTDTDSKTNDFLIGNASTKLMIYDDVTDSENRREFDANNYPPLEDKRTVPFYLMAKNDGNIPVYQRFRVVIPIALASAITLNLPTDNECAIKTVKGHVCSNEQYTIKYKDSVNVGEQPVYAEYYIISNNPLAVDASTSEWPVTGIYFDGISEANKDLLTCSGDRNNCMMGISVYSDAIQTSGFDNAEEAFEGQEEVY